MNDFQEGLLMVIVGTFGYGDNPTGYDIPYYGIVDAVRPWYIQNSWSVDEDHLRKNLYDLVDEGYLLTSGQIYRLTYAGLTHRPSPQPGMAAQQEEIYYEPEPDAPQSDRRGFLIVLALVLLLGVLYYYYGR